MNNENSMNNAIKKLTATLCLTLAVLIGVTGCQTTSLVSYSGVSGGKLPPCKGNQRKDTWTNCRGYIMQSNGVEYEGDFVGNLPD